VEGHHEWDLEHADEVEDVAAVFAAPDVVAVLKADNRYATVVEGIRGRRVVRLDITPDPMADLGGVRSGLTDWMNGDYLTLADRRGQVIGECRDAALAWGVGRDEGSPRDQLAPVKSAGLMSGR
jgi:hypothetical protein